MVEKTILNSGLVVISEHIPAFPSFALSYTMRGGSRRETREDFGIYHMMEHMLFKGTEKYDLKTIADISDSLGGKLNAFTGKEITQYYIKAVDEHLWQSFDILTQMVLHSVFPEEEFIKEQNVALQEIHEAEDNPETNAFESLYEGLFKGSGLAHAIGGRKESVASFDRDRLYRFYKHHYTPDNMILSAVGKVDHQRLVQMAEAAFNHFPTAKPGDFTYPEAIYHKKNFSKQNGSLNQVYVIIGFEGFPLVSPDRHRMMILNDILGAGMSSRLFQKIREEKGLSYTVSSFSDSYMDIGLQMIYSIVEPSMVDEYIDAVKIEIDLLKEKGITRKELQRARESIRASIILGLESRASKMRFNVNNELHYQREVTIEEIVDNVSSATIDDMDHLFQKYLDMDNMSVFLYGDIPGKN